MPNGEEHLEKYRVNKRLLESSDMNIDSTDHFEWVIIVAFYSALHLIEREININKKILSDGTKNHKQRSFIIASSTRFINIRSAYNNLFNSCWKARYEAGRSSRREAKKMLEYLSEIEKELLPNKAS